MTEILLRVNPVLGTGITSMEMVHFIPPSQRRLAMLAAQADTASVLICGGSGSGKGAIARWIHANGPRSLQPFVVAKPDRPLLDAIPAAHEGTLLVTEVGERPLAEQKILLHFLQSRSVMTREGVPRLVQARVMATSSQSLEGRAQGGLFNPELLDRLNVFRLEMPPLAKRLEEFEDIAIGIVSEITREMRKEHLRAISPEALKKLKAYEWPSSLRELRNVLRLAVLRSSGNEIEAGDLPEFGQGHLDFRATREQFERLYLTELLKKFDWQIDRTCQASRMEKSTLLRKINDYGILMQGKSVSSSPLEA